MTLARANNKVDKQQKHQAIIDAAAELFREQQVLPTVATIANNCGQAKGTVYLYFASKESIFLALLQQHYQRWFDQIEQTLTNCRSLSELINCIVGTAAKDQLFFNLASLSCSTLEPAADQVFVRQYRQWFNERLEQVAVLLNRQFPMLTKPHCFSLITNSHALILGLWQQNNKNNGYFIEQATTALARLWKGYFAK